MSPSCVPVCLFLLGVSMGVASGFHLSPVLSPHYLFLIIQSTSAVQKAASVSQFLFSEHYASMCIAFSFGQTFLWTSGVLQDIMSSTCHTLKHNSSKYEQSIKLGCNFWRCTSCLCLSCPVKLEKTDIETWRGKGLLRHGHHLYWARTQKENLEQ